MKKRILLGSIFFAVSALGMDGNELLRQCSRSLEHVPYDSPEVMGHLVNFITCIEYIDAINDINNILLGKDKSKAFFCPNHNVSIDEESKIIILYLKNNPKILNQSGSMAATQALSDAFPCKT